MAGERSGSGTTAPAERPWRAPLLAGLVATVTCAAHARSLGGALLRWDDWDLLVTNPRWRGLSLENLRWMFTTGHRGHFQPLTWISYALEYQLGGMQDGLEPRIFHLTNVLLHALVAVLVFWLGRRLFARAVPQASQRWRDLGAALAALLFALHPLRVESVAWITERRDVLSGVFFVAALLAWVGAVERGRDGRLEPRGAWTSFALMLLCVLSKAYGMVLPALFLLLDVWPLRRAAARGWGRLLLEKLPFLALSGAVALMALRSQEEAGALTGAAIVDLPGRLRLVVHALAFYPLKSLVPIGLSPLYSIPCEGVPAGARFYVELAAVVGLCALAWLCRRRFPAFTLAWLWFVITVLPVSGIALSGPQAAADRYSYHSCLGFALLAGGLVLAPRLRRVALVGGVAALAALGVATWRQSAIWKDDIALWTEAIAQGGPLRFAHVNRGIEYLALGDLDRAEADLRSALAECETVAAAHANLAYVLGERGAWPESERSARRALELDPGSPLVLQHLGKAFLMQGRTVEAEAAYAQAVRGDPNNARLRYRRASLLEMLGRPEEARDEAEAATRLDPADPLAWAKLAESSFALRRVGEARRAAEEAVARAGNDAQMWALAGELRLADGDREGARAAFERVLELRPADPAAARRLEQLR